MHGEKQLLKYLHKVFQKGFIRLCNRFKRQQITIIAYHLEETKVTMSDLDDPSSIKIIPYV